ncbi:MAG TPA: oligogalacturonate lyase family protein [Puia sp.]|jgi:oligogalacturonide lyase|nr:oligogalacturonate lyase family protein [Puia sp.]
MRTLIIFAAVFFCRGVAAVAQPLEETGPKKAMPDEWIDQDTHHKVVRLSRKDGNNLSFYFHNNPFLDGKMIFYSTDESGKWLYTVDLKTLALTRVSKTTGNSEIVGHHSGSVYYQSHDSVFNTSIGSGKTKLVFVFPADFKGNITTLNADETLLAGGWASEEQREISRKYPEKRDFFDRIFDAHLPNKLFTIDLRTGQLRVIHTENTWLGHIQFSPTDPDLLMFCHEGPWHKVDRIWTIRMKSGDVRLMHKRTVDMEIAGHEFFSPDGKTIYFDWQIPKGQTFYLGAVDVATGAEKKYAITRDEWSIHFNVAPNEKLYCGDGGDAGQVAHAKDGRWIYLFRPEGDSLAAERLVNMKDQYYKLEPNVHFSPDGKWVIFRANFEGKEEVYAVECKKS